MRGRHAALLCALALCGSAREAGAKPLVLRVDRVLEAAWLVAEVRILEVRPASWRRFGPDRGLVRVQVTADPRRIYKGFAFLGRTLRLLPSATGPQKCTGDLGVHEGSESTLLLVVGEEHTITLQGERRGESYRLRGWYDLNACVLVGDGGQSGLRITDPSGYAGYDVPRTLLTRRHLRRARTFWARVARFLSGEQPAMGEKELRRCLADLSASSRERRDRAQVRLRTAATLRIADLREAAVLAEDPEARRRLARLLESLDEYALAYDAALRLAAGPPDARAHVLREALHVLRGEPRDHVRNALERMRAELR
jgi:hypothetical protein